MLPQPSVDVLLGFLGRFSWGKGPSAAVHLQGFLHSCGLEAHRSLCGHVVSLLLHVGNMSNAQFLFDSLTYRDDKCWNSLISGHVEYGRPQHALNLYHKMQNDDGIRPNVHTFASLLKACGKLKDNKTGSQIHVDISRMNLIKSDVFIANSLVDMYGKCGLVAEARKVFYEISTHDTVLWTTLIIMYCENGFYEEAVLCFEQMRQECVLPNNITCIFSLKASEKIGHTNKSLEIQTEIERNGLCTRDLVIGNFMIDFYVKCGCLQKAHEVFEKLSYRNVVTWTSLVAGHIEHGYPKRALGFLEHMIIEGITPDAAAIVCSLKACGVLKAVIEGEKIHAQIDRSGLLGTNMLVCSALINMYVECGFLARAQRVFERLPIRNVGSCNALITGYAAHGCIHSVLNCFEGMRLEGIHPDDVTYVCILKSCGSVGMITTAREIHTELESLGLLKTNVLIGNTLVDTYAKCGFTSMAKEVLSMLPTRDVVSWTALMMGYVEKGLGEEALKSFQQMQEESILVDDAAFISCLKACSLIQDISAGEEIHRKIDRCGLLVSDLAVHNTIMGMYAKCGMLMKAQEVFDELPRRNVVSWNILITSYMEHGYNEKAMEFYEQMSAEGVFPNLITLVFILKACDRIGYLNRVAEIHSVMETQELSEQDLIFGNTLVSVYSKWGLLSKAQQVFENLQGKDTISWTALLTGYDNYGDGMQALKCFEQIQLEGVIPNAITFICSLKACRNTGTIEKGQEIHAEIERQALLEKDLVGNTLIHMYAKCGFIKMAQEVFDKLTIRGKVSWTALMTGYVQAGEINTVFHMLDLMLEERAIPDSVTFIVVLAACSRASLLASCKSYFELMQKDYGITPMPQHLSCMINLFGRAGHFKMAEQIIKRFPVHHDVSAWNNILSACRSRGHMNCGERAFDQMQQILQHNV